MACIFAMTCGWVVMMMVMVEAADSLAPASLLDPWEVTT